MGIGQVGLGGITVPHRAGYRRYGQPVVAGYDPDPVARQRFEDDTPDARVYDSLEGLLDDPGVGVIDLATPHHRETRVPLLERIADARRPVLIQKPLAMSYADAQEMVDLLTAREVPSMVNQNMCFTPSSLTLIDTLLRDEAIGSPTFGQLQMQYRFDTGEHPWFGRGPRWWTVGLTVHHLGLLQLIFGPPERVYAMIGADRAQPGVPLDGYGHVALTYPKGDLQVLLVSTGTYYGTNEIRHGAEAVWFQGTDGIIDWSPAADVVISKRRSSDAGIDRISRPPHCDGSWFPDAFGLAMAHFRQALDAGTEPLCSGQDNLYVMAVIEAIYRSGQDGRAIDLRDIMGDRYDARYGTGWSHGFRDWSPPRPVESPGGVG